MTRGFIHSLLPFTFFGALVLGVTGCEEKKAEKTETQKETGIVNVYSARQPELIKPVLDLFEKETGVDVNFLFLKDGLTERLKTEGEQSPADLILAADVGNLADLKEKGFTQKINSAVINDRVPEKLRDMQDDQWFGITRRVRVIAYSKDRVKPEEITSYETLFDPKYKGRICTRSGLHPYMVSWTANRIAEKGAAQAEKDLIALRNNLAKAPNGGDTDQALLIAVGDCDLALINHYYYGKLTQPGAAQADLIKNKVGLIGFKKESGGSYGNISGGVIAKYAPNKTNAMKLAEFLVSKPAQDLFAEIDFEIPVHQNAGYRSALLNQDLSINETPLSDLAKYRTEAIKLMYKINYDAGPAN